MAKKSAIQRLLRSKPSDNQITPETVAKKGDHSPLRSFRERNVRLFFGGLWVSNVGTWAHNTAVVLVIRELGGDGVELGIAAACQFGPLLFLGLKAGAIADRIDRYRATFWLQAAMGVIALALGILVLAGIATLGVVYVLTLAFGTVSAFDNPTRRAFVTELVPAHLVGNVLSLNTSVVTGARMIGPALAALMATATSTGWVFILNGISYAGVLVALGLLDRSRFYSYGIAPRSDRPVRDGLRAIWAKPGLRTVLVVFAVVSTFAYTYTVAVPLLVSDRLDQDPAFYGWLLSMMSLGNVVGALLVARLDQVIERWAYGSALYVGLAFGALSLMTSTGWALVTVFFLGIGLTSFANSSTIIVQQRIDPQMRSLALALSSVLFLGSTPIGGPITGVIGDTAGAVWASMYGAIISAGAGLVGLAILRRRNSSTGIKPSG
jgi:MFS family permease